MITSLVFRSIGILILLPLLPILIPLWIVLYVFKWLFIPHSWWKRDRILIHPGIWVIKK